MGIRIARQSEQQREGVILGQYANNNSCEQPDAHNIAPAPCEEEERGGRWWRLVLLLVALVVASLCFQLIPGDTLAGSLIQALPLAAVAVLAVVLSDSHALGASRQAGRVFKVWPWVVFLGVLGLVSGIVSLAVAAGAKGSPAVLTTEAATLAPRVLIVFVLCLLTGLFEEGIFRAVSIDAFAAAFGPDAKGLRNAVICSALLFGIAHLSSADFSAAMAAGSAIMWSQAILKPIEAAFFGAVLAVVFVHTRNLWIVVGIHSLFDLLSLGPTLILTGLPQTTYATGSLVDMAVLAAITALLIGAAIVAMRTLHRQSIA